MSRRRPKHERAPKTGVPQGAPSAPKDLVDIAEHAFGDTAAWIMRSFSVCSEIFDAYEDRLPLPASEVRLWLCPPGRMVGKRMEIYASHCRELLERVCGGRPLGDLRYLTRAELMLAMSEASERAPLTQEGALLYHHLFEAIFGDVLGTGHGLVGTGPAEAWPGQLREALGALATKTSDRRPPPGYAGDAR